MNISPIDKLIGRSAPPDAKSPVLRTKYIGPTENKMTQTDELPYFEKSMQIGSSLNGPMTGRDQSMSFKRAKEYN